MKIKHTIVAGCLLAMGLASCEMKEELRGGKGESDAMGVMNLSVQVDAKGNDVVTKAGGTQDGGEITVPAVSAEGYEVEISNAEGPYKTVTYDSQNTAVELPVGDYTIYAHAPGEPKETEAYYGGRTALKVVAGKSVDAPVTCKMMNTKIQLTYTTEMQASFKSWDITVTAGGKNKSIVYDGTNFVEQPDPFFWMLPEGTKEITINFLGTNMENKPVPDTRVIRKPAAAENSDWLGGDMLRVDLKPGASDPNNPDGVLGIVIDAKVEWNGIGDPVDVPVDEEPTTPEPPVDPGQPGDPNAIKVSIPQTTYTLPDDMGKKAEAIATITSDKGLKSLKVIIEPGNDGFKSVILDQGMIDQGVDFSKGVEFVDQKEGSPLMTLIALIAPNLKAPTAGATSYEFPLGEFFEAVSLYQATNPTGHVFKIMIEDNEGNVNNNTVLSIVIKETQAQ